MVVTISIGSSCHLKGSRDIISIFQRLVSMHGLSDQVELTGSFCMGQCEKGVCLKVDDELFSVTPATAESFFNKEILGRV